jgi:benzoate membrane transport protein
MPFVVDLFSSLNPSNGSAELSIVVASALLGYVLGLRFLRQLPAVLPAFIAGVVAAAATGSLGALTPSLSLPDVQLLTPEFSWQAILTVAPVVLALLTLQANVPSVLYMRSQGFEPPERAVNVVSGVGTVVGSLLGPVAMSLALPATLVVAGPGAGERSSRYRSVAMPIAAGLLIALFAGTAAELAVILPPALLLAIAGLALVPALLAALREISAGPLVLGPLFAFAIALSDLTFLGLGPFFWSLVLGTLTSFFLEREGWDQLASRPLRGTGTPR